MHFGSSRSKPFIVEADKLIKIRFNFQSALREFWIIAMETFTDMTKLVESFGIVDSVL